MGNDIEVINENGEVIEALWICASVNWGERSLTIHDLHGHCGETIAKLILDYILEQRKKGYKFLEREVAQQLAKENPNFWYGCHKDATSFDEPELTTVYCTIMMKFLERAVANPDAYWYNDQSYGIRPNKYGIGRKRSDFEFE